MTADERKGVFVVRVREGCDVSVIEKAVSVRRVRDWKGRVRG